MTNESVLQAIEIAKKSGKIRKGVNEVTKSVERGKAQLVAVASDVSPKELVMHLPILCEEKSIVCKQDVASREELGAAAGLAVPTVCVSIENAGDGKDLLTSLKKKAKQAAPEEPAEEQEEAE